MKNLSEILFTAHEADRYPIDKTWNSLGVFCLESENTLL